MAKLEADIIEGTPSELRDRLGELPSTQRYRLIPTGIVEGEEKPFWATATTEEWIAEFEAWSSEPRGNAPPLSDFAVSRESIYEGRD